MPISGHSSYIPTANEFIAHWLNADSAFGSSITLRDGVTVDILEDYRDELSDRQEVLINKLNQREYARGNIKAMSQALVDRLEQFNGRIRVLYADGQFLEALPEVPDPRSARGKIIQPLLDAKGIWVDINDGVNDLVLSGGYVLATFESELAALQDFYESYEQSLSDERYARAQRNSTQDNIYPILKQYRQAIPTFFAEDSPEVASTPDAVNASAVWDEVELKAKLVWDASTDANLKEYEVRYTPGDTYEEDDASVVANVLPADPRELLTLEGLTQPGATSSFKVFVILTTGNEAGSEALVVERPLA